jgi:hypothetical protein
MEGFAYTIRTDTIGYPLAAFDRYSVAVRALPLLADSYDRPVQIWEGDTLLAVYMAGHVLYMPGVTQVSA